ncbi:hypothetical protein FRC18_000034 [Serendipita sp. 400]|nr:hypothetical protein FRC18_000034 [Serendipita sp. 400]
MAEIILGAAMLLLLCGFGPPRVERAPQSQNFALSETSGPNASTSTSTAASRHHSPGLRDTSGGSGKEPSHRNSTLAQSTSSEKSRDGTITRDSQRNGNIRTPIRVTQTANSSRLPSKTVSTFGSALDGEERASRPEPVAALTNGSAEGSLWLGGSTIAGSKKRARNNDPADQASGLEDNHTKRKKTTGMRINKQSH